jgi:hypothetical protein
MQWIEFVDGRRVKVWSRPDVSSAVNKFVSIDGAEDDTDKEGKPCFKLMAGKGGVSVQDRQPGTSGPVAQTTTGKPIYIRTVDDYEVVLSRAIATVTKELAANLSDDAVSAPAVATIVTSYMAAYVRGDFAVPSNQPKDSVTEDGEEIPNF